MAIKKRSSITQNKTIQRIIKNPAYWVVIFFVLVLVFLALFGRFVTPYGPLDVQIEAKFLPPGVGHWLGTDNLGRDLASRTIAGTGLALRSCVTVLFYSTLIGLVVGITSGYYGGWVDEILMRISDIFIAFPGLVLALAIAAALGPSLDHAMVAISAVWWPSYARLIRGQVLSIKERDYIQASKALGSGDFALIIRHIVPNILTPLLVQITSDVGPALVTTSSLSFIGMGAQPPTPEWGSLVSQGRKYLLDYWWMSTFPGAAILVMVLVFSYLGEMARELLQAQVE
jgi:peptide/nickel transport system permease protein